jgi:Na+-transporting methylmalonyl-CoA/oxaloacetate decarboxylase beta subunit
MHEFLSFIGTTAVGHFEYRAAIMIVVGLVFVYLGISKHYEPLLLVPIGFGIVLGNMPGTVGVYIDNSVMNIIYFGVSFSVSER